ncbi:MAG: hypothetical protein IKK04_09025 [Bacteroidales bacterium]|nr:hypothetical protein [Bacteroidales bacterium]
MKKILAVVGILSALVLTVSCQKDQNYLRASFSPYQGGDKVYIKNQYACWSIGDTVWINGNGTDYTIMDGNNGSFLINTGSTVFSSTPLTALYPSNVIASGSTVNNNNQINITLPHEQKYVVKEGKQIVYAPMVATVTTSAAGGGNLVFTNLCSLLKVQVHSNVFVHTITVRIADGSAQVPLAGPATVDFSSKTLTMASSGTFSSITLTVNNRRSDGIYYIVVPPYATSTKLEVEVYDDPHSIITVRQKNAFSLDRNIIATINCDDSGKGLFSISSNARVSFAKGNLTGTGSNDDSYAFNESQTETGDQYSSIPTNLPTSITNDWILLTDGEWDYLLDRTCNGHKLYARASLTLPNGTVQGLILFPDNWDNLVGSEADNINYSGQNMNQFNYTRWSKIEEYGAVFLPAIAEAQNHYWTSEQNYAIEFGNDNPPHVESNPNTNASHKVPQIRHAILVEGTR